MPTTINLKTGQVQNKEEGILTVPNIFQRSGTEFVTVSKKVAIGCVDLLKIIAGKQVERLPVEAAQSEIMMDTQLLAKISTLPPQEKKVLPHFVSGVFAIGMLSGMLLAVLAAMAFLIMPVRITLKELFVAAGIVFVLIVALWIFVGLEPRLKSMQKKHEEKIGKIVSKFIP